MLNWETWFPFGAENEDGAFPSLEELYIKKCPKLKGGFSTNLPSLAKLEIDECPQLVISLRGAPAIHELELMHCNEVLLKELPVGIQRLRVGGFDSVESLPEGLLDSNSCLQELEISDCSSLVSLPMGGLSIALLEKLELRHCDSLRSFPLDLFPNLKRIHLRQCGNLQSLTIPEPYEQDLMTLHMSINNCPNFESFPKGGFRAPNLTTLDIWDCKSLTSLPEKMNTFLPSLDSLCIVDCPEWSRFQKGACLPILD
ncbi:hypothetical protein CJ030_MR0G008898 [Morella rubra]|uniref:Disease resistance RPP13-like protein 1 n=1 Tax=Morella rubra TaxID=262757 RepID=A0A6A1UIU4_9ROSI|nr:hypothetical protein CJ030_MR0G008898 [Morella rubra]